MTFHVPEKYRITKSGDPRIDSDESFGNNGAFIVRDRIGQSPIRVIASSGGGWEHVSVSIAHRTPTWGEMCWVKDLFWDDEDCVIQFHPPRSQYVNVHPFTLHLWRPIGQDIIMPPGEFV